MLPIRYLTSNPSKRFEVNEMEKEFFAAFELKWPPEALPFVHLIRMSDGTLAFEYGRAPIGKIKLQGRKHSMQVLRGLTSQSHIFGSMEDFIAGIDKWIVYYKKHLRH